MQGVAHLHVIVIKGDLQAGAVLGIKVVFFVLFPITVVMCMVGCIPMSSYNHCILILVD